MATVVVEVVQKESAADHHLTDELVRAVNRLVDAVLEASAGGTVTSDVNKIQYTIESSPRT